MAFNKLTEKKVSSFNGPGRIGDGGGLWLTAQASGSKQWTLRYTLSGKRREMGLGSYPIIPLAQAREKALEARRLAKAKVDPIMDRQQTSSIMTFANAAREVHRINLPTWKNKKHTAQFISTLETYVFPVFGNIAANEVQSHHVLSALQPIWNSKEETARRVKQRIGQVMKWCMAQGWRTDNPVDAAEAGLPKQTGKKGQRKALDYEKVPSAIAAVRGSQAGPRTKLGFECLVLTAVRSSEVRGATWDEFDLDNRLWIIPAERMKMDREHRVPLTDRVMELLEEAKTASDGSPLVFAGAKYGKPMSDATLLKLIREKGFGVDIHGFRSSFRTWAAERSGALREVAELALAHNVGNAVEQAYSRTDLLDERRDLMNAWAEFCQHEEG